MEILRKEYKMFMNVVVVEQNRLVNSLQESELALANLKAQVVDAKNVNVEFRSDLDTNRCRCKVLEQEVETKEKECHALKDEVVKLTVELEKCQDELKLRKKYNGGTEALDKMLSQQKHSKDNGGLGCGTGECSTSKETSQEDIQFVSSNGKGKGQTFTV